MAGRFSVEAVFKAVDQITAPVSRMQNRVGKFTRSASRGFRQLDKAADKFVNGLKRGVSVTAAATLVMGTALLSIASAGSDFEQAITNVGAVSLKTRAEIAPLEKMALDLGKTTKFTATQAANAMEVLARAGFGTQDILQATPAILDAAAASGLEIAEVADHVSNALKGMGLSTNDAARVADVLALASSKTNSSIGSLGESIRNVASTARDLNIPFEQVAASVALLQDVGLDASVAGSAFNTMLTKMAAPTDSIKAKMDKFGISFKDAKGDMLPLQKVLEQLSIASKKAGGNFDKVAFLAELVGLRGQKAASNLATLFETGKLEELIESLDAATGSARKMAELRMDTVQGSLLLLSSAVDAVKVKIFGLNEGPLKALIDSLTSWVSANEDVIATNIGGFLTKIIANFRNVVKWAKRISIAIGIFLALALVLKTFIAVMTAVNLVMALNPVGLIVLGIVALIAVVSAVVVWWDELVAAFMRMPAAAATIAAAVLALMGPIGILIGAALLVMRNWEPIKDFFVNLWASVTRAFDAAMGGIIAGIEKAKNLARGIEGFFGSSEEGAASFSRFGGGGRMVSPQVVSPQERVARSIEESRTTSSAEVTIRDETNRAEVTGGSLGPGLSLLSSGAF